MIYRVLPFVLATGALLAQPSLKRAAEGKFLIGGALNAAQFKETRTADAALIKQHFNTITAENVLKWGPIHPEPERYDWAPADAYVEFGERHGMFVVGHTLVWHSQTPKWVFEDKDGNPANRDVLIERMHSHIHNVVSRYKGRVKGWDVVNEALNEDGTLRQSPWMKIIGEDYLLKAFQYAQQADPGAELYYNDYGLENPAKRQGAIALVKKLRAAGAKVSGIGTQTHIQLASPPIEEIDRALAELGASGVKVMVTELDISVLPRANRGTADINDRGQPSAAINPYISGLPDDVQAALARRYGELFAVFAKHAGKLERVTFWGVTDATSWLNNFPVRGRTNYPLLFDREAKPKPAFSRVMAALERSAK